MWKLKDAPLELNETVAVWPAGPSCAAATAQALHRSHPPVSSDDETLPDTSTVATGAGSGLRHRTVGTSPTRAPVNSHRMRAPDARNGNSNARCWFSIN